MTFTETPFLILVGVVFALWLLFRNHYRVRLLVLLTGSLWFYGYRHRWLLLLLLTYCLVNYLVGLWIATRKRPKFALAVGVGFNLSVLAFWKYTPLLLETAARLALAVHLPAPPVPEGWVIPFGISFYAFCGIAYMVDVYRRVTPAERDLFRYTLSATFFPHLVAGPILRPDEFLTKLRPDTLPNYPEAPLEALLLIGRGLFKKMVLADRIALAVDPFFAHVSDASTAGVWSLPYVYLYAFQIYFDFSGYTDIARGLGLMFGFRWPENFDKPYLATSIQDFWRRWHMTLSRFLRDYLYIPLGGNRNGEVRTHVNLMLTMLLGGLWHGASWSFLLWGGLHGFYLVVNRLWDRSRWGRAMAEWTGWRLQASQLMGLVLTFQAVCLAWVFFRLPDLREALLCLQKGVSFRPDKAWVGGAAEPSVWLLLVAYGVFAWLLTRVYRPVAQAGWQPLVSGLTWGFGATLLVLAVLLAPGGEKPAFIYFQF